VLLLVFSSTLSASTVDQKLVAIAYDGSLYEVNVDTGTTSLIGNSGIDRLNSLATDGDRLLFSVSDQIIRRHGEAYHEGVVVQLNIDTGAGFPITPKFNSVAGVRALAFSSTTELYAVLDTDTRRFFGEDALYKIDLPSGSLTKIGLTGKDGIQSLAFDINGDLYGWDSSAGLITFDRNTGIAVDINPEVNGFLMQTIEFDNNGLLFAATLERFYSVDPVTGQATYLGDTGLDDLRGLAFVVPEPSILSLIGLSVTPICCRRRH